MILSLQYKLISSGDKFELDHEGGIMSQHTTIKNLDLDDIRKRAYRAVTRDGLLELLMGIGFAAAVIFVALDLFLDVPLFFLIGVPAALLPALLAPLRTKYTHPRVGYVEVVSEEGRRLLNSLLVGSAVFGVIVLCATLASLVLQESMMPIVWLFEDLALVLGVLFGAALIYMALRYSITRFFVFGLVSVMGGLLAQIVDVSAFTSTDDPIARWMVYFAVMTVVLLPSGVMTFYRFLRENPVLDVDGDDGAI